MGATACAHSTSSVVSPAHALRTALLSNGGTALKTVAGEDLLFARIEGTPYAYRPDCPSCGESKIASDALGALTELLVRAVATRSGRLVGAELQFLRSHAGWSRAQFAWILDAAAEPDQIRRDRRGRPLNRLVGHGLRHLDQRLDAAQ